MSTTHTDTTDAATLDEICVAALADAFLGDGEILCNAIGMLPTCAARLARATSEPALMLTDGVSLLVANTIRVGAPDSEKIVESYMPYRSIFDAVWSGRRHVVMGAAQIDRYGNQNLAAIGDWRKPKAQLLGLRGAPGNAAYNTISYWIPNHSANVFVEEVDVVCAPGYDRVATLPPSSQRAYELRRVVTNLGVFDFATDDHRMRVVSRHPGVTLEAIQRATSFELAAEADVPETRLPSDEELRLLREVIDPTGVRKGEFR